MLRVAFADNHTLVVVRVLDEEHSVFLPARPVLNEAGFNPDLLQPQVIVSVEGYPHKVDKLKFWATGLSVV
ncbi:MAG: hypothetical protein FJX56_03720 [Alphaproteobacteria bacterium]|nr:hypothetical protein [Alphaproteobacteria bacterium]